MVGHFSSKAGIRGGSQGRIQTRSTYTSAEVTSAVVKLLKKYRNTRFLLQIILFFSSADRKD